MPLKIVRRKGTDQLYLRGSVRGRRIFETTGTNDSQAAENVRITREAALLQRSIFGAGATVTFAEAASSYLAAGGEAKYLGRYSDTTGKWSGLIGQFTSAPITAIGQVEADDAARKLYPGTAAATRRRQLYVPLKAVLNHASEKWRISVQRIKAPKVKKTVIDWASPEYVGKLLQHCPPKLRLFVALLVYTGERLEKIVGLDWDNDVSLALRAITFRTTKNGEMRTAHIPDPLLIELTRVPEPDRQGRMFDWKHKTSVHKPLKAACERAGVRYLSPHPLGRHTYATWLRQYAKRDLRGLMEDVGWKSINSAVRYAHVVAGESVVAVDKLPMVQIESSSTVSPLKDRKTRKKLA